MPARIGVSRERACCPFSRDVWIFCSVKLLLFCFPLSGIICHGSPQSGRSFASVGVMMPRSEDRWRYVIVQRASAMFCAVMLPCSARPRFPPYGSHGSSRENEFLSHCVRSRAAPLRSVPSALHRRAAGAYDRRSISSKVKLGLDAVEIVTVEVFKGSPSVLPSLASLSSWLKILAIWP